MPEIHYVRTRKIPGKFSFVKQTNAGIGRVIRKPSKIAVGKSTVGVSEEAFRRFADKENSGKISFIKQMGLVLTELLLSRQLELFASVMVGCYYY